MYLAPGTVGPLFFWNDIMGRNRIRALIMGTSHSVPTSARGSFELSVPTVCQLPLGPPDPPGPPASIPVPGPYGGFMTNRMYIIMISQARRVL